MPIWVDADACPVPIREILCRAAARWQINTTFIANHFIKLPRAPGFTRGRYLTDSMWPTRKSSPN